MQSYWLLGSCFRSWNLSLVSYIMSILYRLLLIRTSIYFSLLLFVRCHIKAKVEVDSLIFFMNELIN